ncbi:S1C family serine protease [Sanguibacter sp. A247]|uniref:S1C family serine protease n=1 Tax=unclassified Sanguibacter TaxID=2645534 RepID=UPI003FD782D6
MTHPSADPERGGHGPVPPAPLSPFASPASPYGPYSPPQPSPYAPPRPTPYGAPAAAPPGSSYPPSPVAPAGMLAGAPAWGTEGTIPGRAPRRQSRGRGLGPGAVVAVIVLGLASGSLGAVGTVSLLSLRGDGPGSASTVVEVPGKPAGGTTDRSPTSLAGVAAAVLPSVVSFEVRGQDGVATGSGFVYSADGYVITNNHVVAGASSQDSITVTFADGAEVGATVVGRTEGYDLAVVKVDRTGLTPLTLGDSESVVVGDPVIAIGAPLGLEGTVTTGIVSALNRPVTAGDARATSWINALQTDAAINPGNSGGPLVNLAGEVVGVNSAIAQAPGAGQSGSGSIGLGFAIPANQVRRTAEQLIETGRATRPIIGALIDNRYEGEGVRVVRQEDVGPGEHPVTPGGPADKAGVRPGDIIVAINGRAVTQEDELLVTIRALAPGDEVTLTIREAGRERDVTVVLDEADAD